MTNLALDLDDTNFQQLTELSRSLIPTLAPGWTDHNVHDPGITLLELLAWVAEAQIYSLGRTRKDERRAYARLLGIDLTGPTAARGLLWPDTASVATGQLLARGTQVSADDPRAPEFQLRESIELSAAQLTSLSTRFADGSTRDWTRANTQQGATFQPFGARPAPGDRLQLKFRGILTSLPLEAALSIGIEVAADAAPLAARSGRARLRVALEDSAGERAIELVQDSTEGLLHSGVLLVRVPAGARSPDAQYTLSIQSSTGEFLRVPRLQRLALNVLPIVQQSSVQEIVQTVTTEAPDRTYQLQHAQLLLTDGSPELQVEIDAGEGDGYRPWQLVAQLEAAGPDDRVYALDASTGLLRFGNGVNGRCLPGGAALRASYRVSVGALGNLPKELRWRVAGQAGWVNADAIQGGASARTLDDLRAIARSAARQVRPLVTASDLTQAALAFVDLNVARAHELLMPARSCEVRGTRRLVAVSGDVAGESGVWLDEIRARLQARLPLGQRLVVLAPRYVTVGIRAKLMAAANLDPQLVRERVAATLAARLAAVAPLGIEPWRLGREITLTSVKGWLRATEGVARVIAVELYADGQPVPGGTLELGAVGLPRLSLQPDDLAVERFQRSAR